MLSDTKLDFSELSVWSDVLKVPRKGMVVHCVATELCSRMFVLHFLEDRHPFSTSSEMLLVGNVSLLPWGALGGKNAPPF